MFIVFRHNEIVKGYFKKKKQLKSIRKSEVQSVKTDNGLPFYMVDIPVDGGNVLWDGIEEKCGKYASRIIASRGIAIPDSSRIKRYISTVFPCEIIFNTAMESLKSASCKPDSFVLTLTDRNGFLSQRVCELLPFCSTVRVITCAPEKYARPVTKALNEYGATLIMRQSHSTVPKREIVICCDGAITPSMSESAVFSHKKYGGAKLMICGSNIVLNEKHRSIIPDYISPIDFAGALTELCGCNSYSGSVFADTEINGMLCKPEHISECISSFCFSKE